MLAGHQEVNLRKPVVSATEFCFPAWSFYYICMGGKGTSYSANWLHFLVSASWQETNKDTSAPKLKLKGTELLYCIGCFFLSFLQNQSTTDGFYFLLPYLEWPLCLFPFRNRNALYNGNWDQILLRLCTSWLALFVSNQVESMYYLVTISCVIWFVKSARQFLLNIATI